jgi:chromosome segregation ATPase
VSEIDRINRLKQERETEFRSLERALADKGIELELWRNESGGLPKKLTGIKSLVDELRSKIRRFEFEIEQLRAGAGEKEIVFQKCENRVGELALVRGENDKLQHIVRSLRTENTAQKAEKEQPAAELNVYFQSKAQ